MHGMRVIQKRAGAMGCYPTREFCEVSSGMAAMRLRRGLLNDAPVETFPGATLMLPN